MTNLKCLVTEKGVSIDQQYMYCKFCSYKAFTVEVGNERTFTHIARVKSFMFSDNLLATLGSPCSIAANTRRAKSDFLNKYGSRDQAS